MAFAPINSPNFKVSFTHIVREKAGPFDTDITIFLPYVAELCSSRKSQIVVTGNPGELTNALHECYSDL